ncbi:MAG: hypothetical protein A2600_04750 [Candidatus Lambdaproteobacteria bacterium RIFOXYD1_FULL_56_27]|uniref:Uncharacterized protein n=1 Tax=Candidatus Lambdaproteobacteria bacterium RIFOXYD2_FULL_56_26 TaxID=1817773 RepID=A0A1F6H3X8_9PROT|nr:MAG: hypothetical protein A2426_13815 [Candidatus Lambdaproteobacteria bacterium RIFOXYC1_FULL_56_13]OGH05063.1 MAG: hypothetical protein A2557_08815 [Candidatus Lambdaproteobacteria bacterium RIFOXYD2_FULL_56_26]OGH09528.1 MAG: hypothetical protein A2600_04750 [Candidatus Lambdaproteobacteria bacterium RIFOXYD1_FULL_56_27]
MRFWLFCIAFGWVGLPLFAQEALNERSQVKLNYLKALANEQAGRYDQAHRGYRSLPLGLATRKQRLFLVELRRDTPAQAPDAESLAYQVRYLLYQEEAPLAYQTLKNSPLSSEELTLERARLELFFGRLPQAKVLLAAPKEPEQEALRIDRLELTFWLHLLEGDPKAAYEVGQKLEGQLLYLPRQSWTKLLFPPNREDLERWLLLFPDSEALLEELIDLYKEQKDWAALDRLCQQQAGAGLPEPRMSLCRFWELLALGESDFRIEAEMSPKELGPAGFEELAQRALAEEDWSALERIGQDYSKAFPQLEDGERYLALGLSRSSAEKTGSP